MNSVANTTGGENISNNRNAVTGGDFINQRHATTRKSTCMKKLRVMSMSCFVSPEPRLGLT
jgi:hypothetical protein